MRHLDMIGLSRKEAAGALEAADLHDEITPTPTLVRRFWDSDRIISASPTMRSVIEWAKAVSDSTTPVLILGETGTGKETIARAIHASGPRRDRPFVPVNCAALPHDLVESELFGHRRGAFSGALADHPGLFVFAQRGTLLLDEIGEFPAGAQAKLLRVLQSGEIRPVGGVENRIVDVRVIAATNRGLGELRAGALRQDLFYRLSVVVIEVPPLRQRPEDIAPLFEHFLARHRHGAARLVEPEALDVLASYPLPRKRAGARESCSIPLHDAASAPGDGARPRCPRLASATTCSWQRQRSARRPFLEPSSSGRVGDSNCDRASWRQQESCGLLKCRRSCRWPWTTWPR